MSDYNGLNESFQLPQPNRISLPPQLNSESRTVIAERLLLQCEEQYVRTLDEIARREPTGGLLIKELEPILDCNNSTASIYLLQLQEPERGKFSLPLIRRERRDGDRGAYRHFLQPYLSLDLIQKIIQQRGLNFDVKPEDSATEEDSSVKESANEADEATSLWDNSAVFDESTKNPASEEQFSETAHLLAEVIKELKGLKKEHLALRIEVQELKEENSVLQEEVQALKLSRPTGQTTLIEEVKRLLLDEA